MLQGSGGGGHRSGRGRRGRRPGPGASRPPASSAPNARRNCWCAGAGWENSWAVPVTPNANSPRISPGTPRADPVPVDKEAEIAAYPCPREGCTGGLLKRRSRRGFFYGCSNYPKCDVTMNQPPLDGALPPMRLPLAHEKRQEDPLPRDECGYQAAAVAETAG